MIEIAVVMKDMKNVVNAGGMKSIVNV